MRFNRLRISGFKSFADPIEFAILPGVAAIVGPNGCGKSNLVDAMRWVMGEASFKTMRGGEMDDVIFSGTQGTRGTQSRPPREMAEVALMVDNKAHTAPAPYTQCDEIEISRRIERESGSTYRINGADVRARDVHLFFADIAGGAHSASLVGQGQIERIVAAKPFARREVLEEAAGVQGLHKRRHEAELRLRAAQENLDKLTELLRQNESRLRALKRQSRQAARYRALSQEIARAELLALYARFRTLREVLKAAAAQIAEAAQATKDAAQNQSRARAKLSVLDERLPQKREAQMRAGAALERLQTESALLAREAEETEKRIKALNETQAQTQDDLKRTREWQSEAAASLADIAAQEKTRAASEAEAATAAKTAQDTRARAEDALRATEAQSERLQTAAAAQKSRIAQLNETIAQTAQKRARVLAERDAETQKKPDKAATALKALRKETQKAQDAETASADAFRQSEATHEKARAAQDTAREAHETAARTGAALDAEARAARELLGGTQTDAPGIIDDIDIEPGFETALAAALGDDLIAARKAGAHPAFWHAFWQAFPQDTDAPDDAPALPDGIPALSVHVRGPALLARRLAQIGVVDAGAGAAMQAALAPGQRLVSREGHLWRWDGYVATPSATQASVRRIEMRRRFGQIQREAETARAAEAQAARTLAEARAAYEDAAQATQQAREAHAAAQSLSRAMRLELSALERRADDTGEDSDARRAHALLEMDEALDAAQAALHEAEGEGDMPARAASARARMEEARKACVAAQSDAARAGAMLRETETTRTHLAQARAQAEAQHTRAAAQITALETRQNEARKEMEVLSARAPETARKTKALETKLAQARDAQAQTKSALDEVEAQHRRANAALREADEAHAEAREAEARAQEQHKAAEARLEEAAQMLREKHDIAPDELPARLALAPDAHLPDAEAIQTEITRLAHERDRLGEPNLRAEEEASELKAEHEEMARETSDLEGAVGRLRQSILQLNREVRTRMTDAFASVSAHFSELFTRLFGGGQARLTLVDSDDPLEAGLDIMAQPPGKKLQRISLLSGGEKALTALALIFAVFRTRPSPICVLDEVDAPLDERNVARYCTLLDDMAQSGATSFIVVTHHPLTMARADRLFGVVMQEKGISRLVSVDLSEAEAFDRNDKDDKNAPRLEAVGDAAA